MTDQDRNKAWGFALFGDDVRIELGGKTSLMGMYQADMLFPSSMQLPIVLAKFVIEIMYYEILNAIEGDIVFRISYGPKNQLIAEMPVLRESLGSAAAATANESESEDSERIIHIRMPLVLSPLQLTEMGRLRVRVHYSNGSVLKLGSIAIKQLADDEFQAITGLSVVSPPPSVQSPPADPAAS